MQRGDGRPVARTARTSDQPTATQVLWVTGTRLVSQPSLIWPFLAIGIVYTVESTIGSVIQWAGVTGWIAQLIELPISLAAGMIIVFGWAIATSGLSAIAISEASGEPWSWRAEMERARNGPVSFVVFGALIVTVMGALVVTFLLAVLGGAIVHAVVIEPFGYGASDRVQELYVLVVVTLTVGYIGSRLSFSIPISVAEECGAREGLLRSWQRTDGMLAQLVGIWIGVAVVAVVLSAPLLGYTLTTGWEPTSGVRMGWGLIMWSTVGPLVTYSIGYLYGTSRDAAQRHAAEEPSESDRSIPGT